MKKPSSAGNRSKEAPIYKRQPGHAAALNQATGRDEKKVRKIDHQPWPAVVGKRVHGRACGVSRAVPRHGRAPQCPAALPAGDSPRSLPVSIDPRQRILNLSLECFEIL